MFKSLLINLQNLYILLKLTLLYISLKVNIQQYIKTPLFNSHSLIASTKIGLSQSLSAEEKNLFLAPKFTLSLK